MQIIIKLLTEILKENHSYYQVINRLYKITISLASLW